jgi:MFS family permease
MSSSQSNADRNWRRFVLFRVLFNSRFYYPVLAVLFLDLGLSATQYTLLNFAWALAIVLADVPAGVLADRLGRKPLVVGATICMVGEMALLILAPRNGGLVLFLFCLANRVLSGVAEGMASGADEALVFDSLAERNRSDEWPLVLDQVIRWQSVGMVIAMLVGGASYDPVFMNRFAGLFGFSPHWGQASTLRFPIYLNLVMALFALAVVLGFREPKLHQTAANPGAPSQPETALSAWRHLISAGRWIIATPVALFVLVGGLMLDSIVRLFLTFSSSYFRLISLPEATYGLIGAGLAGLGLIVSPVARRMVRTRSLANNFLIIALVTFVGLVGVAFQWPFWGVIFVIPLGGAMTALGFMISYYLNALVDSRQRATVLSFKGLAFNLGYGFLGLLFALVLKAFQDGSHPDHALAQGFRLLPLWLVLTLCLLVAGFWRHRKLGFSRILVVKSAESDRP